MTTPSYIGPAGTFPWFIRLSVDVDPAGNPIGRHITLYQDGKDSGTIGLSFPHPFDSVADAFADLVTDYTDYIGTQPTLF